jgi:hypothetical protein
LTGRQPYSLELERNCHNLLVAEAEAPEANHTLTATIVHRALL